MTTCRIAFAVGLVKGMASLQTDSYHVILQGATHDTFSDAPLLLPSSSEEKAAHVRRAQIVREYIRAFLDRYLKSATMTLLDEPKPRYPEIELGFQEIAGSPRLNNGLAHRFPCYSSPFR